MSYLPLQPKIEVEDFTIAISDKDIEEFKTLLKLSKLPPVTHEGTQERLGITREWMKNAKTHWEETYDWRTTEAHINKSVSQYKATVTDKSGKPFKLHFAAAWNSNSDATPLLLLHGWPGSYIEFLPLVEELKKAANPGFHVIVPSLPGYCFSDSAGEDKDMKMIEAAYMLNELVKGIGFEKYVIQGGDIGHWVGRMMTPFPECRGILLNMFVASGDIAKMAPKVDFTKLPAHELGGLQRAEWFEKDASAYALLHGTRPSTIAHCLSASPLALLAWIGEKFRDWTDVDPPLDSVLDIVTLWWFTETFPRAIYPYREIFLEKSHIEEQFQLKKPWGYSWFPKELFPMPKSWLEMTDGMIFFNHHEKGGHFAGLESPKELTQDIIKFVELLDAKEKSA